MTPVPLVTLTPEERRLAIQAVSYEVGKAKNTLSNLECVRIAERALDAALESVRAAQAKRTAVAA